MTTCASVVFILSELVSQPVLGVMACDWVNLVKIFSPSGGVGGDERPGGGGGKKYIFFFYRHELYSCLSNFQKQQKTSPPTNCTILINCETVTVFRMMKFTQQKKKKLVRTIFFFFFFVVNVCNPYLIIEQHCGTYTAIGSLPQK